MGPGSRGSSWSRERFEFCIAVCYVCNSLFLRWALFNGYLYFRISIFTGRHRAAPIYTYISSCNFLLHPFSEARPLPA